MGTQGECHTKKKEKLGQCIYKPRKVVSKVLETKRKAHKRFSWKALGKAKPVLGYHHLSWTLGLHRLRPPLLLKSHGSLFVSAAQKEEN